MLRSPSDDVTWFRLMPGAVECDDKGLRIDGIGLLERKLGTTKRSWEVPTSAVLEKRLHQAYGIQIAALDKWRGLQVVADALSRNDIVLAQIATLHLKLPEPSSVAEESASLAKLAKSLFDAGWFVKDWDPDKHPRAGAAPNPGWFAPSGGADGSGASNEVGGTSHAQVIPICVAEGISIATDEYGNKLSTCHYVCFGGGAFSQTFRGGSGCPPALRPRFLN